MEDDQKDGDIEPKASLMCMYVDILISRFVCHICLVCLIFAGIMPGS